jgi:hypothetical protein
VNTYGNVSNSTSVDACTPCYNNSYAPAGSDSQEDCSCLGGYERQADAPALIVGTPFDRRRAV